MTEWTREQIEECRRSAERLTEAEPLTLSDAVRETADRAVDGIVEFNFNGRRPTSVGRHDIDWTGGHHAHQEWRAQLNRFFFLRPLATAYRETGQEAYAEAARDFIEDWIRRHPSRKDWTPASSDNMLNLSIRVGTLRQHGSGWTGNLPLLMSSPAFDDNFVTETIESIACQVAALMANPPLAINWRIAAADCMISSGLRLAFLPEAETWRSNGVAILNDAFHRQVLPDGAHYERNPGYHTWMTNVMADYWRLGRKAPELGLAINPQTVLKMWDYALAVTRPNGDLNALHDCRGARSGSPPNPCGKATREGRMAFRHTLGLDDSNPELSQFFPDAGQALLRTDWEPDATYVTFDATKWGSAHCHLSRNSLQLHAAGRTLLPDPGTFTYESSDPFSAYGRSTPAHNTCNLNGYNQATVDPMLTTHLHGPGYDLVRSDYEGGYWDSVYHWEFHYQRDGIMASHCRILFWIHDLGLFVLDSMKRHPRSESDEETDVPSLECNWQLCEGGAVSLSPGGDRLEAVYGDSNLLMLFPHRPNGMSVRVAEGEKDPAIHGWLPTEEGFVPAPQVCMRLDPMRNNYEEIVTLLIPFTGEQAPPIIASVHKAHHDRYGCLSLDHANGTRDEIHWTYRLDIMLDHRDGFDTDGALAHVRRREDGLIVRACAAGATYLAPFEPGHQRTPAIIVTD